MKIQVTQPAAPVPAEVLATSIQQIAEGMKALNSTRLTRKALIALIHDQSKVSKKTIEIVLNNLQNLEHDWLKPRATVR
jgi:hypothetical protein